MHRITSKAISETWSYSPCEQHLDTALLTFMVLHKHTADNFEGPEGFPAHCSFGYVKGHIGLYPIPLSRCTFWPGTASKRYKQIDLLWVQLTAAVVYSCLDAGGSWVRLLTGSWTVSRLQRIFVVTVCSLKQEWLNIFSLKKRPTSLDSKCSPFF